MSFTMPCRTSTSMKGDHLHTLLQTCGRGHRFVNDAFVGQFIPSTISNFSAKICLVKRTLQLLYYYGALTVTRKVRISIGNSTTVLLSVIPTSFTADPPPTQSNRLSSQ